MDYDYRYAVIGAGPGGLTASVARGVMGQSVCLIERGEIGGDCTNFGCVPSKSLLHAAKSPDYPTLTTALDYAREQRAQIRHEEREEVLTGYGVDLIKGTARFAGSHTLQIDGQSVVSSLSAQTIIIATGAAPKVISLPGVVDDDLLTNESFFEITEQIDQLVIIGGGVIACEISEACARLGVAVTIVEKHGTLLNQTTPDIAEQMHKHLTGLGVETIYHARPMGAANNEMTIKDNEGNKRLVPYDKVLLAVGREPVFTTLQLDNAQVTYTKKGIETNRYSQTNQKHIYAIGDCVAGNPKFTHRSNHEARLLVKNLTLRRYWFPFHWRKKTSAPLPWTIYTDPEIAHVGLHEHEARQIYGENGLIVRTKPFSNNDRSKITQETGGYIKIIAKRVSLKLVGVTIVSPYAGELLPQYTIAMQHGISLWGLNKVMFAYPTQSEIIKQLIDAYLQELLTNPRKEIRYLLKYIFLFWR